MRKLLVLAGVGSLSLGLTACQNVAVKDSDLIRPDNLTGYKTKAVFDAEKLNKVLPQAQLKEEAILVQTSGADATQMKEGNVTIKGVSVTLPEAKATVLYFGGNLTHVDENGPLLSNLYAACPANFATFDYRGYGRSNGAPDVHVLKEDALRIYDHVRAKTQGKLVVYGFSLGSFMAGYIAANRPVDGLVLEGSSTNPYELINARIPWYYRPFVTVTVSDNLKTVDNQAAVSAFTGKALVITGENDVSTPAELGRKLFESMPSQDKNYYMVPNGTHSALNKDPQVRTMYCNFIQKLG